MSGMLYLPWLAMQGRVVVPISATFGTLKRCLFTLLFTITYFVALGLPADLAARAQTIGSAAPGIAVAGVVQNESSQQPLAGAIVRFQSAQIDASTRTNAAGQFELHLPPGQYTVTASASGYKATIAKSLAVGEQAIDIDIAMAPLQELKLIGHVNVASSGSINTTPMAVTSISANAITTQGPVGIGRILSEIPGVSVTAVGGGTNSQIYSEYAINSPATPVTIAIRGSQPYEN